jgi:hypothetical protein
MLHYKISSFCSFFKAEKYIKGYIDNMLEQSIFKDIEFIFLDCASPENEKQYILPLTKTHKNIKYHRLEKDLGLYNCWNYAIENLCTSDMIGNWNADDRKSINSFEILYKEFERNPDLDLVYGQTYISRIANEKYMDNDFTELYPFLSHSFENLIKNNSPHCMPLWKKSLHDKFGYFDEKYPVSADGDMWLKACVGGAKIKMVNHPVGLYYLNPEGNSTKQEKLKEAINEVHNMRSKYLMYKGYIN